MDVHQSITENLHEPTYFPSAVSGSIQVIVHSLTRPALQCRVQPEIHLYQVNVDESVKSSADKQCLVQRRFVQACDPYAQPKDGLWGSWGEWSALEYLLPLDY